jgi:hypothetical protein
MKIILTSLLLIIASMTVTEADQINELSKQYAELRAKQKALPQSVFDKELSGAGGKLEQVLDEMGKRLSATYYTQQDIIRMMGQPDAIKSEGDY